jgi:nitric oxide reductase subunit B
MTTERLKWAAIISFIIALGSLLVGGLFANREAPPYPGTVTGPEGNALFSRADIIAGQDVYQRYGLMDHGSVWGHGSQRGMEFSAVTVHLVAEAVREQLAQEAFGLPYDQLDEEGAELVALRVRRDMKTNGYDKERDTLRLSAAQVKALEKIARFWETTFKDGDTRYGFLPGTVPTAEERRQIGRFFFWTAWVASANRPGEDYSYTNNWPPDRTIGNVATTETYIWTIGGIVSLFITLGLFIFWIHRDKLWYGEAKGVPLAEKLIDAPLTSSQLKAAKFFLVVILLFLVQTCFGGLLAHYTVHPGTFYISAIGESIPYSWAKSWHLQLAIFWIATTWIASAIYLAPIAGVR